MSATQVTDVGVNPIIINMKHLHMNFEEIVEYIYEIIEKSLENREPVFFKDSDGIGSYEFWGFKGFHKGETWLVCEGSREGSVTIKIRNISREWILNLAEKFTGKIPCIGKTIVEDNYEEIVIAKCEGINIEPQQENLYNIEFFVDWAN